VNTKAENQIVKSAIAYLLSTYDVQEEYWPQTFLNVNDEPHAQWWHLDELKPPEEQNWANASAELVGYLHRYSILVSSDFIESVTERAKRNLESQDDIRGFYNIMNWQRAAPHFPEPLKSMVNNKVESFFIKLHPLTQEKLRELKIFKLAPSPHSILAQNFPETVDDLLDSEIKNQAEDGGWWPTWNWSQYEDEWKIVKVEWAGKLTVECLHTLKSFGKIAS
jgi:hypothetical protein